MLSVIAQGRTHSVDFVLVVMLVHAIVGKDRAGKAVFAEANGGCAVVDFAQSGWS